MRFLTLFAFLFCSAFLCSAIVMGQNSDPFGSDDPFGRDPFSDKAKPKVVPKANAATTDPFGSAPGDPSDPFAKRPANPVPPKPVQWKAGAKPRGAPPSHDIPPYEGSEAEHRIRAGLSDETTFDFIEVPFSESMEMLGEMHDIPIVIDSRALEEIGLDTEFEVTLRLKNVTLRSALRVLLRQFDLTYEIDDEVLQVTTYEAAEKKRHVRMYRLPPELASNIDEIIKTMQKMVRPEIWDTSGGPASASSIDHVLVIATSADVQAQVVEFLSQLNEMYEQQ